LRRVLVTIGLLLLVAIGAVAQDAPDDGDNGFLINLLENRLSAPGRQIRLSGISGALSSRARIQRITISDARGAWLEIDNVELDWSRLALLRGRVSVNRLSAERIAWLRRAEIPPAPPTLPKAEAQPFALPELPVAIQIAELSFPSISFDESVFGQAAELALAGALDLRRGTLQTNLEITRLDAPGGNLALTASFSNATRQLAVDLDLHEPEGGVVATLLNVEGRPAIDLSLEGEGPLDQLDLTFALDAAGERIADGLVALRSRDQGLGFDVDFSGELSPLIPAQYRDFFAGESSVRVQGVSKAAGGLRIDELNVSGAVLNLDGGLETTPDGFLRNLTLTGALGDPAGEPVLLPVPGGRTRLQSAVLHVNFGEASRWNGLVVLDRLEAAEIGMEDVTLRLGGLAQNLEDPARRNVTVNVEGLATGLTSADPEIARALGSRVDLFADAALRPNGPVVLNQLQLSGNGLSIFSAGEFEDLVYTGRNAIRVADLAVFSGLANRPLAGSVDFRAEGSVSPLSGGFDLEFDGTATDLALGDPRLDGLLAGETQLSGGAVRDESGFRTENLRLANPQVSFASNGSVSSTRTDIGFEASLADLAVIDPRASGTLTATGRATGQGRPIAVSLSAAVPSGSLMGRSLTEARIGFTGEVDGTDVTGSVSGDGSLGDLPLRLSGDIAAVGEARSVSDLEVVVGPNRLTGEASRTGADPVVGRLVLDAPDIAPLAALALTEATGAVNADIVLDAAEVGQGVTLTARASDVAVGASGVGTLDAEARVTDALGLPMVEGTLDGQDLALGGVEMASLQATANQIDQNRMRFSASSRLVIGTLADLSGELARLDDGFAATLEALRLRHEGASATLAAPATVTVSGGNVELTPLHLDLGTGSVTAEGRIDQAFDVDVALRNVPLALANAIRPDLGLAGTVNGTARVTGPRAAPDIRFDVTANGVASAATRGAGLPPVGIRASGQTAGGRLNLDAGVTGQGIEAAVRGAVPLGEGNLDLQANLRSFPLALVDRAAGNQGLRGTVSGTARITGTLSNPAATFDVRGEGLTARVLSENALPPFTASATGDFRGGTVHLASARLTGVPGFDISGSGRIPLSGPGLDVGVSGTVPLAVANPLLADRAAQVSGTLRVDARAQGSIAQPRLSGSVTLQGGTAVDPGTNLRLQNISLDAGLEGNAAILRSFRAEVVTGGEISAQGRVTLAPGYPADLAASLRGVRWTDGITVSTRIDGDLAVTGPLVGGGGLVSGEIVLGRTEISVAEGFGAAVQAAVNEVEHVRPPPGVAATLERARVGTPGEREAPTRTGIGLDVRISAPSQIFVRGRGLDVELGGGLRIQGTTTDVRPVGQFDLRRGRLLILGQRIEFDEGSLQLVGNLDPIVHFVARTQSQDVTAIVTVEGRVSSPEIHFSSEPPLPEDEVLARVLFNRTTQNLSAFQLAQLAAAAAELAGAGGPGVMSQIRGATGLDDLDIITEDDGSTAIRAGRYIDENIYLNLQTDTEGVTRAEINLDVSESVTARGSVASDGNTTIGIYYERDY
jgi:translocation and assembly module TamB